MAKTSKEIMRTSIFILLKNFNFFTSTPTLVALPFALATLIAPSLVPTSPLFPLVHHRVRSLSLASGLTRSSKLSAILNYKLSQTILSSLLVSPFVISFLLLSKAFTIRALRHHKPLNKTLPFSPTGTFKPLLITHLCNLLLVLSTNTTFLCVAVVSFSCSEFLGFSSRRAHVLLLSALATAYSIVLANAYIVCGLSLALSGLERRGGFRSILRACIVTRDQVATALSLSAMTNVALAGVEALFQYRVVRAFHRATAVDLSIVLEVMLVAYLYAMVVVLDTIVSCVFLKGCLQEYDINHDHTCPCLCSCSYSYRTEIWEVNEKHTEKVKG